MVVVVVVVEVVVLSVSSVSVDLYAVEEKADIRRLFNWMNTVKRITTSERILLDNSDPFNAGVQRITGSLMNQHRSQKIPWIANVVIPLMNNEFQRVPQQIRPTSNYWITATTTRTALLAYAVGQVRLSGRNRNSITVAQVVDAAKKLFNDDLPMLRSEWASLKSEEILGADLPAMRRRTLAFDHAVLITAAWSLHKYTALTDNPDIEPLAAAWHDLNLTLDQPTQLLVLHNRDEADRRVALHNTNCRRSADNVVEAATSS